MFTWFRKKEQALLPFATDMHCHITPGIDDGSESVAESVELMQHMQQWGLKRIIPTPHVTEDTFENTPATVDPAYESLVAGAHDARLEIELLPPSGEYRLDSFFLDSLDKGLVRPLSGHYLLVENGFSQEAMNIDEVLFDLGTKGFQLVLAHPERYMYYHRRPERYRELHSRGILFQCNLMSIGGYYGKEIKRITEMLLKDDMIDFLGTDLHGMRHVRFIDRYMSTSHFKKISDRLRDRLLNDTL